ncbi:hypothetical protein K501DRAFT_284412 [Backusella circina FSU 941]|nr:hypothetical protein K501DRAFT_284412 [Backusella circina FSU 941]
MSLHGYATRVDEYDSEDDVYHSSPYHSPRFQRRSSLQKPPMRYNPGYYDHEDQDDINMSMRGMTLEDYPPRWTPPFFDEPHPGYIQRPFLVPEDDFPYFADAAARPPPPPRHWAPPPGDFRFQGGDPLSDSIREPPPFLHRSLSSRSHRPDRPNQQRMPPPRRFQEYTDESDDEPPLPRRSSTGGFRIPMRQRRSNSLSAMPTPPRSKERMRPPPPPGTPFHYSEDDLSVSEDEDIPTRRGPRINRSHSFGNFAPMQPNGPPVILPQHMPPPVENGPPPPMGPPNPMFVPQPGDYFEPRLNTNLVEGTGPSTPSGNEPNNPQPSNNNNNMPPPPHMGQWMGPPPPGPPVFPGSPGGNNPMFNQQNMMGMGMPNPMVNMFNNPMMGPQVWGFPSYPMTFMGASEPTLVNPESTSPHRTNEMDKQPRPEHHDNKPPHPNHPDMQAPPPLPPQMKPESSSNGGSRRRFSIFNLFGKKNEYHFEPPMQPPFPEDQFRGGGGGVPLPPPFQGPFNAPIQGGGGSTKERKKIEQYEKLGIVWAWRIAQDPDNLENIQLFCPHIDVTRHYSFNINNQKLIKKKQQYKQEIMLGSEKNLNGNLMIRPNGMVGFFIPKNSPNRNDPVVIRLDLIFQTFNREDVGNGFVFNHNHLR